MKFVLAFSVVLLAYQPSVARTAHNLGGKQSVKAVAAQHKAVFRRYVTIWESGALDDLPDVLAPNYVGHVASGSRGVDGLRDRITRFRQLYPDVRFVIEDQVAEGDRVATRLTATATSSATGKVVKLVGLNVSRFQEGRIAEEWPVWETAP